MVRLSTWYNVRTLIIIYSWIYRDELSVVDHERANNFFTKANTIENVKNSQAHSGERTLRRDRDFMFWPGISQFRSIV